MDVYGFYGADCPYPYNQTDEFSQQAMAPSVPFHQGYQGPGNTLVPSGSPWNSRGMAWGMQSPPHLVHFTGQTTYKYDGTVVHCKRKSLDVEPATPAKQHITEEKMAAHLNSLHISLDYTAHADPTSHTDEYMDVGMEGRDADNNEKLKGRTIVLSDEVKRIREEPILPATLMERIEKPTMSLVVWQPRENILNQINSDQKQEEPRKRNSVLIPDTSKDVEMWPGN